MNKPVATLHTSIWPRGHFIWAIAILASLAIVAGGVWPTSLAAESQSSPDTPDRPTGTAVFVGGVDLEWNDVAGADSYDVQLYRNGQWTDLPGDGIETAFYGAGAIISGLDPESTLWFRVRASNSQGSSDWSTWNQMPSTNQSTSGRRSRPDNVSPTGAPAINGTARVWEVLTADTSNIEDGNGLDRVQFRFQWVSHDGSADTDIAKATDSTYTVAATEVGKSIKVRVGFTDRGGYAESLTGGETATVAARPNSPATGAPSVTGASQVGEMLTADTSGISDADGLTKVSYSYQWLANDGTADTDITNATGSTYTLAAAEEGKSVKVTVSFTDDAGNEEVLTSSATATVEAAPNTPATGAPAISGVAQVGETLTADTSGISDADGLTKVSYSYQWVANDGTADTDITNATDSTYAPVAADEGKTIKVTVSFTDDAGNEETLASPATAAVKAAPNTPAAGAPAIIGTAQVGETLAANTTGIADADGLTNAIFTYRWIANDGTSDADIATATDSTYTLVANDEGKTIKVQVSFTDDAGHEETLTSAATDAVISASEGVSGQSDSEGVRYITVWVTEDASDPNNIVSNFTVVWHDVDDCSANYNGYLNVKPSPFPGNENLATQHHLGSAPSDSTRLTNGLTGVQGDIDWFNVEVYCGTDVAGRMVSKVEFFPSPQGRPNTGTYSTEPPLWELSVSHGTLTPSFNRSTSTFSVPDVANDVTRMTITATPKEGYAVNFLEWGGPGVVTQGFLYTSYTTSGTSEDCEPVYTDKFGRLLQLTDADPNTEGFQVDLYDDPNHVMLRIYPTAVCEPGERYYLTATRAEGSVTLTRPNRPTVGAPKIMGGTRPWKVPSHPWLGQILRVDLNDISDRDGWDPAAVSYQWFANDAEIAGATSSRYQVTFAELGKSLNVRVSFTDYGGAEESVTSPATDVVVERILAGGICDRTQQVRDAIVAQLSSVGHCGDVVVTDLSLIYGPLDLESSGITALQSGDFQGLSELRTLRLSRNSLSELPDGVFDDLSSLTTLYLDNNHLSELPDGVFDDLTYMSSLNLSNNGLGELPVGVFDNLSYLFTLRISDNNLSVLPDGVFTGLTNLYRVDLAGNPGANFTVTAKLEQVGDDAVVVKVTEGAPFAMQVTLSVEGGTLSTTTVSPLPPQAGKETVIVEAGSDSSEPITVTSTGGDGTEVTVSVDSAHLTNYAPHGALGIQPGTGAALTLGQNRLATGAPTIRGTAQVGETLTADISGIADADGLNNVSYSYQWVANDGTSDTDIAGETDSTFTLLDADEGNTIKVRVNFTDDAGHEETLTSAATATVVAKANSPATGAPAISGTAQVGETLTADTSGISDPDGLVNVTFSYQWVADDADIAGATASTYSLVAADEGQTIKVEVNFTDDAGNGETLTSAATAAVAAPEPPAKPTGLSTASVSHDGVSLTWDDPQDDSITGYVVLRRDPEIHPSRTFVTIAADTGSANTTYTDDTVEPETRYVYRIQALNEYGSVSERSHRIVANTPAVPVPDKPTGLSTVSVSHDGVSLTWDDPQDDSITGYVILRRDRAIHAVGTFVTITADTGSADTTYTDDTVEPEKQYNCRIKAINSHGESKRSGWVPAETPAAPA